MKKIILILIASIGASFYLFAQSAGDYRSVGNGNWNDPTKWQIFNGISWVAASTYPGQNPGTESVYIMNQTEIIITATVPNPVYSLFVDAEYGCSCDNYSAPHGKLTFSSESAISLTITGGMTIYGELLIDDRNGAKSHSISIGGSLSLGDAWWDYEYYQHPTVFQTINQDDKLNVTFNTSVPNSTVYGYLFSFLDLSLQDVTFNGIGISFQTGVLVNGHANFINGKVSGITFADGATHSGASAASYVAGSVTKQGDDAFTFPIGNGNVYAPLTISAPSDPGAIVSAGYIRSSASNIGPISDPALLNVSNCEYWVLNSNNNNLNVTVNWSPSSGCESSPYVTNVSEVTLAHFDNTTQRWNSHGGSGIGTPADGSVTWNGVNMNNSYGYFTLGNLNACNAPWGAIATNITTNSATLSWTAVSGAISYDVDYSSSSEWINAATATTNTSVNLSGLSSGSYYQWRIRTNCSSTSSPYRQAAFNTLCGTPSGLTTSNVTYNSATLNWSPVFNANYNYTAQYKQSNAASWTSVNGYSFTPNEVSSALMGLSPSTGYDWRVVANCPGSQSNYAQASFTTPSQPPCNDVYESNNSFNQAMAIGLGNTISASISSSADIDWFKITTPNSANNGLWIMLGNLPADYDLYLYDKRQKLVAASANTGTANDVVTYNSNARNATYYIKVLGKNGAFNTSQCYTLLAQAISGGNRTASNPSVSANEVTENTNKQFLYPNPASEFVYLNFNSATEGSVNIQIVNSIGQLIKQHPVNTMKGQNQIKIQVADIRPGMYILRINKGDLNLTKKFVIAR
jgi:Secretion system C-terminal sorting domain/Fibronectin type III domain